MQADDTPAIEAVLNADKKRLELLALEKELLVKNEAGDAEAGDKLKEVRWLAAVRSADSLRLLID